MLSLTVLLMLFAAIFVFCTTICVAFGLVFFRGLTRPLPKPLQSSRSTLHVAFLHPDFGIGGAENLVVNAALGFQKKCMKVSIFTAHHDVNHCFEETRGQGPLAKSVVVYGDWLPRTLLGRLYAACATLRMLYVTLMVCVYHTREVDVFFVDQVSMPIPFLRMMGKPVLFYGHFPDKLLCVDRQSFWKRFYRLPLDILEELTTSSADLLVVNSRFTKSVFESTFPRVASKEMGILYPPVDVRALEEWSSRAPARNTNLFVSLNRFERKKNVQLAIHALAALKRLISNDNFSKVRLVIAGGYDPNNQENIEHLQELQQEVKKFSLESHVEFMTSVSDRTKKVLLATAQAILYTPSREHFGIVPVEAMACGTPVIAVSSGGPLESIAHQETGFLCESTSESFANAMAQLCGESGKQRVSEMGQKGRRRARHLFSLETFADSLEELVSRVVTRSAYDSTR